MDPAAEENVEKQVAMEARLKSRHDGIVEERERRRVEREAAEDPAESAAIFSQTFKKEREAIDSDIQGAQDSSALDALGGRIIALQALLTKSSFFLPPFDLRTYQEAIRQLEGNLAEKKASLVPKKKFAFKSRANKDKGEDDKEKKDNKESTSAAPVATVAPAAVSLEQEEAGFVGFRDRDNAGDSAPLVLCQDEIKGKDVMLARLKNCTVHLKGNAGTVHMSKLENCTVLVGPCTRSIFLADMHACTLVLACQQLRMHTSKACTVYLHVSSRAIIEDCTALSFAPYAWAYDGIDTHFQESGLKREENHWDCIDDFLWIKRDQQSPNWSILPEHSRITFAS